MKLINNKIVNILRNCNRNIFKELNCIVEKFIKWGLDFLGFNK